MEHLILASIAAATPLLVAAIGELMVERAGVLNLGVEGMMVMGAVSSFGVALWTGWPLVGLLAGIVVGMLMALVFAILTQSFAASQVVAGIALTLFGLGLSGFIGASLAGHAAIGLKPIYIPFLTDIPVLGRILFGQHIVTYLSIALVAGVAWFLFNTRLGLILRGIGNNHDAADALGFDVIATRYASIVFGGACAGLAGGHLALTLSDMPQWSDNITAGRGFIALALVAFAAWWPWRLLAAAWLLGAVTIFGPEARRLGLDLPAELWAALPYLVTILVLAVMSGTGLLSRANAPASLGRPFLPGR
ncbi:MAG TPA: ABC transporter permease [Aestuariivirgaceae bacterium]|nr:ABC transporter permease [Aestuariivirgaceae bacterium]